MAPMTRSRATPAGVVATLSAEYYAQRVSIPLIITGGTQPSAVRQGYTLTPGIYTDKQVSGWRLVTDAVHQAGVFLSLAVLGFALGLVFVPLSRLSLLGIAPRDAGVASAMLNTTQQLGGALGVALLNTLYASAVASYLAAHSQSQAPHLDALISGYRGAFAVGGGLLLLALLVVVLMIQTKPATA